MFTNYDGNYNLSACVLYGSDDNVNYTQLTTTFTTSGSSQTVTISSPTFYKYYKIHYTKGTYAWSLREITITATYMYTPPSNVLPVVGNGMTLGLTSGTNNFGVYGHSSSGYLAGASALYGSTIGTSGSGANVNGKTLGLTADAANSGLVVDTSNLATFDPSFYIKY